MTSVPRSQNPKKYVDGDVGVQGFDAKLGLMSGGYHEVSIALEVTAKHAMVKTQKVHGEWID